MNKKRYRILAFVLAICLIVGSIQFTGVKDVQADGNSGSIGRLTQTFREANPTLVSGALGVAGAFHVFALETAKPNVHTNGNIAAAVLDTRNNFGTNQLDSEITYARYYDTVQNNKAIFRIKGDLVLGENNEVQSINNGAEVYVNGAKIDAKSFSEIHREPEDKYYIDLEDEFNYLRGLSVALSELESTNLTIGQTPAQYKYVTLANGLNVLNATPETFAGMNNFFIDGVKSSGKSSLDSDYYEASPDQVLVINVDLKDLTTYTLPYKSWYQFDSTGENEIVSNSESTVYNKTNILYNFYSSTSPDGMYHGELRNAYDIIGAVLAPCANIKATAINGSVIGENVETTGGETHRCDFIGNLNVIVKKNENNEEVPIVPEKITKPSFDVKLSKIDTEGVALDNAVFEVFHFDGKKARPVINNEEVSEITVTTAGITFKLPEGKYYLKEKTAPAGYVVDSTIIPFEVTENGTVNNGYSVPKPDIIVPNVATSDEISISDCPNDYVTYSMAPASGTANIAAYDSVKFEVTLKEAVAADTKLYYEIKVGEDVVSKTDNAVSLVGTGTSYKTVGDGYDVLAKSFKNNRYTDTNIRLSVYYMEGESKHEVGIASVSNFFFTGVFYEDANANTLTYTMQSNATLDNDVIKVKNEPAPNTPVTRSISGHVWVDADKNGKYDVDEYLIQNVNVELHCPDNTTKTTTTDENGFYSFSDLDAGEYTVEFKPGNDTASKIYDYTVTSKDKEGVEDTVDSDADVTEISGQKQITISNANTTLPETSCNSLHNDLGLYKTREVSGLVWVDANKNGIQDDTEKLEGVTVTLKSTDGATSLTTTTDSNGLYKFENVPAGKTYKIEFSGDRISGYTLTEAHADGSAVETDSDASAVNGVPTITLSEVFPTDETINGTIYEKRNLDAGFYATRSISGHVWIDQNRDGAYQTSEVLVPGVKVELQYKGNQTIDGVSHTDGEVVVSLTGTTCSTTTSSDADNKGYYEFTDLPKGSVKVVFTDGTTDISKLSNYSITTTKATGVAADVNSDAKKESGVILINDIPTVTGATYKSEHNDLGIYKTREISGSIWNDDDKDGIQDDTESKISEVTVTLKDGDTVIDTVTTTDGTYEFKDVPAGVELTIEFSGDSIDQLTLTEKDKTTDDTKDSDAELNSDNKPVIVVPALPTDDQISGAKEVITNLDAGFYATRKLSGYVWIDQNRDGEYQSSELRVPGVSVSLVDSAGNVVKNTSNADCTTETSSVEGKVGYYEFTDLPEGTFKIKFTDGTANIAKVFNYEVTEPNKVSDTNKDSDAIVTKSPATEKITEISIEKTVSGVAYDSPHNDLGIYKTREISGLVWEDTNKNGIQDDGEPKINVVTVTLKNGNTVVDTVTTTDGTYKFENVPAGVNLTVEFSGTSIANLTLTALNQGTDDEKDSDATGLGTGNIPTIQVPAMHTDDQIAGAKEEKVHLDAGFYMTRSISGHVWIDEDWDGEYDADEILVPNVKVELIKAGTVVANTTTSASGYYEFTDLAEGQYTVKFSDGSTTLATVSNYVGTSCNQPGVEDDVDNDALRNDGEDFYTISNIDLTGDKTYAPHNDLGIHKSRKISGLVWIDENHDGIQNGSEQKLSGVEVTLYNKDGITRALDSYGNEMPSVTTGADGKYEFACVPSGLEYVIVFSGPAIDGYTLTTKGAGIYDNIDDDAELNASNVPVINTEKMLSDDKISGTIQEYKYLDAGFYVSRSLSGRVWIDQDRNGQYVNETLVPGVTVKLVYDGPQGTHSDGDTVVRTTGTLCEATTDDDGYYEFLDLPAGDFKVVFIDGSTPISIVSDYGVTKQNEGSDENDSDADITEMTISVTVPLTKCELRNNDLGLYKTREIEGLVWYDKNHDGIQNGAAGEEYKIPNVIVTLTDKDGNKVQNIYGEDISPVPTDSDGKYKFTDLPAGVEFKVQFSGQALDIYTLTKLDQGTGDTQDIIDSDAAADAQNVPTITIPAMAEDKDIVGKKQVILYSDAGFYIERTISGHVWLDKDVDSLYDDTMEETLVENVVVTILDKDGNPLKDISGNEIPPTTTGLNGEYEFTNLPEGDVTIVFSDGTTDISKISEYNVVKPDKGDDTIDNDATKADGIISIVKVTIPEKPAQGESKVEIKHNDLGLYKEREISGKIWEDTNKDGIQDPGEKAISGIKVTLVDKDGNVVKNIDGTPCTMESKEDGSYKFTGLPSGDNFKLIFEDGTNKITDYVITANKAGGDNSKDSDVIKTADGIVITGIKLPADEEITGSKWVENFLDAGLHTPESGVNRILSGTTWVDANQDGKRDAGETLLPGVTVTLIGEDGKVVKDLVDGKECATKTDKDGNYLFENLPAGTIKIVISDGDTKVEDYFVTKANAAGVDESVNSNASKDKNGIISITEVVMPTDDKITQSPYRVEHQDAGFYKERTVSGMLWIDKDKDGIRDADEVVIAGLTIELKDSEGNTVKTLDGKLCKTETDKDGKYEFTNVPAGTFDLVFSDGSKAKLSDYTLTFQHNGDDADVDSDAVNGPNGSVVVKGIVLPKDENIVGSVFRIGHIDAGFYEAVKDDTPKTGDSFPLIPMAILIIVSGIVIFFAVKKKREN